MADDKWTIERLSGNNWQTWKFQVKHLLLGKGLWNITVGNEVLSGEADQAARTAHEDKSQKALSTIVMLINPSQLYLITSCETAKEAWNNLKQQFESSTLHNKLLLKKQYFRSEMSAASSMEKHLKDMKELTDRLAAVGAPIAEEDQVVTLLGSLPTQYNTLVTALEARGEDLRLQFVQQALLNEEQKLGKQDTSENLMVAQNSRFRPRTRNIVCYHCGKDGHMKRNCPEFKKKGESVRYAAEEVTEIAFTSGLMLGRSKGWYIDSGATSHVCNDSTLFKHLDTSRKELISVANGDFLKSEGRGECSVTAVVGEREMNIPIKHAMYAPKAPGNLLSVKRLTDQDFSVSFDKEECYVKSPKGETVATGRLQGDLYKLCEKIYTAKAQGDSYCVHQWHERLGHRNLNDIRKMELSINPCSCSDICESCIVGKMSRKPFPKKAANSTDEPFDIVVSDVCGPIQVESVGGSKYFVTFIDVFTRYCKVYFIKNKSDVAGKVTEYIENVKTKFGRTPKTLRTDRGGEYMSGSVQEYLKKEGIEFQCTVGYSPQQNGIAERKNRSLVEVARTMLNDSNLSKWWWAEAVNTANHIQNRVISQATNSIPYEKLFEIQLKFDDLHVFGEDVYVKIHDAQRQKLDDKATKMKFLGYDVNSKGYRLGDVKNRRIVISRDVKFLSDSRAEVDLTSYRENDDGSGSLNEESQDSDIESVNEEDESSGADEEEVPEVRKSHRSNKGKLPGHFTDYVLFSKDEEDEKMESEPRNFKEASKPEHEGKWVKAMEEELKSIADNETWELVDLPEERSAIGSKWVYKMKYNQDGTVARYKARLVAQGYTQKFGTDYDEVFAPVVRPTTFRAFLSVAGHKRYEVKQFDIKTAFLNGKLSEEIYMKQPPGFEVGTKVCKLNKSLYGLKQAARAWNIELGRVLSSAGCIQSDTDPCLYKIVKDSVIVGYVLVYVDDLLISGLDNNVIDDVVGIIQREFEVKALGDVKFFLGIEVSKNSDDVYCVSQERYIEKIIDAAGLSDAKVSRIPLDPGYEKLECVDQIPDSEYRALIGMLLYVSVNTRPDICASVSILSQKLSRPTKLDLNEVKRVIRYLKGTIDHKLRVGGVADKLVLEAYSDANWAENRQDRKSNSGYMCYLGGTVSWTCRKQNCVSLSSTEAEYIALAETCQEVIWLRSLCEDFDIECETTVVNVDNQSCVKMCQNEKFSKRTKHVDTKYHFTGDLKEKGIVDFVYCPTDENVADMLTKPLKHVKLETFRVAGNVVSV